jgi:hypothetical protein
LTNGVSSLDSNKRASRPSSSAHQQDTMMNSGGVGARRRDERLGRPWLALKLRSVTPVVPRRSRPAPRDVRRPPSGRHSRIYGNTA